MDPAKQRKIEIEKSTVVVTLQQQQQQQQETREKCRIIVDCFHSNKEKSKIYYCHEFVWTKVLWLKDFYNLHIGMSKDDILDLACQ